MDPVHGVVLTALWALLLVHGLLLLLLYRQVERSYRASEDGGSVLSALPAGTEAPELQVLRGTQVQSLSPASYDGLHFYLFTNTTCDACTQVVEYIAQSGSVDTPVTVLVAGEGVPPYASVTRPGLEMLPLAHPADAAELYGVLGVPALYALKGGTILVGSIVTTPESVDRVLAEVASAMESLVQGGT